MADRYWVGGSGTWNSTNTTNWSATDGGAGGASVPAVGGTDNVFFTSNSNTGTDPFTVTVGAAVNTRDLTISGLDGAMTLAGTSSISVRGSMTLPATNLTWTQNGGLLFVGTTAYGSNKTITTSGVVIASPVTFNSTLVTSSPTNTLILQDAFTTTSTMTLSAGTLNLNGYTLTGTTFNSSATTARTIAYGATGIINLTGTGSVWVTSTITNFSYTGTSTVRLTYSGSVTSSISPGSASAAQAQNFYITAGTYSFSIGTGGVNSIDFSGFSGTYAQGTNNTTVYGNLTFSGTMTTTTSSGVLTLGSTSGTDTITTNGHTLNLTITLNAPGATYVLNDNFSMNSARNFTFTAGTLDVNSQITSLGILILLTGTKAFTNGNLNCVSVTHTSGALSASTTATVVASGTYTFTAGSISIADGAFISAGQFSSSNSNARSIAYNSTGELRLTGTGTVWNTATVTNFSYTGISNVRLTYSGASSVTITTGSMSSAQAQNFYITTGTYGLTTTTNGAFNNLDFTGFSGTYAQASTSIAIYGNLVYSATMTTTTSAGSGFIVMSATSGTTTITTNGITINNNIRFNGTGGVAGTYQLADNFTQGTTSYFNIINGTVDFNNVTHALGVLQFTSGTSSYINYGGVLTPASVIQTSGNVTTGTGALINTPGQYNLLGGTLTISDGVDLIVGALATSGSTTRAIDFGTGRVKITGANNSTVINMATTTGFSFTGTSNLTIDPANSNTLNISHSGAVGTQLNVYVVSGTNTINIVTGSIFRSLDFTGFAGTLAMGTGTNTIYGDLVLGSAMTTSGTGPTNHFTWAHTTGARTITTNGVTVNFGIRSNGAGGIQLADTFTQGSTHIFGLTAGTIDLNFQSVTAGVLNINTGTHAITNGTVNCASVSHNSGDLSIGTGYLVVCSGTYTFTAGTLTINDGVTLSTGLFSSNNTNTREINFGSVTPGIIEITGNNNTVFNVASTTGLTITAPLGPGDINFTYSGSVGTRTIATGSGLTGVLNFSLYIQAGSDIIAFTSGMRTYTVDFTGFSGTWTNVAFTIYGSLTLSPTMTVGAGSNTMTYAHTTGSRTIISNGQTLDFPITLSGGGTVQLGDAFIQGSTRAFGFASGTFDMAGYSTVLGVFTITTGTHALLNGTATCASVTHTSGNLTVGLGYGLICNGTYTLTNGTITINDDVTLSMFAFSSNNSNAGRSIAFGTSGLIEITGKSTTVWNTNLAGLSYTGSGLIRLTATGSGTTTNLTSTTGALTSSFKFEITAGSYPITTSLGMSFKGLDFTGYAGTWNSTSGINLYGDLVFSSLMSLGTAGSFSFGSGIYDANITCNGKSLNGSLSLTNTGTITLTDSFSSSSSINRNSSGTLTANSNVTATIVTINGNANLGSGVWYVTTGSWTTASGSVIGAGTSTISMGGSSTKTFAGADKTYYNLEQGGTGDLIITGSNSFNDITASAYPSTITITSGTTQTVSNFTLSGTSGNIVTLNASTPGSAATLSKASGTVSVSYLTISDSTATGGAVWQAYTSNGNTDGGGNSGWDFGAIVAAAIGAFFAFF